MVSPRRQRARNVADEFTKENTKQTTLSRQLASRPRPASSKNSTPENSPSKPKSKPVANGVGSKPIYSFFNAATQSQQKRSLSPDKPVKKEEIPSETIDIEDISDDDSNSAPALGKRAREYASLESSRAGPKFLKSASGRVPSGSVDTVEEDSRPWTERYPPKNLDELVVHKKKVQDVRQWLEGAFSRSHAHRVLILKGPAGSGKTATLQALSKPLGSSIVEWRNPSSTDGYMSNSAAFDDFIIRSTKTGGLDLVGADGREVNDPDDSSRQIILVEEFPTFLSKGSLALDAFRSTILQYLAGSAAARHSTAPVTPLVIVVTESTVSQASNVSENFTAHRLLGRDILGHPGATVFEFNAVAPTFISKALNTVFNKHSKAIGQPLTLAADVIKRISEIGDLRNATSTAEYLCSHLDSIAVDALAPKGLSKKLKATKQHKNTQVTSQKIMELIALRESSIGLFHAIGKIVYNKRESPEAQSADRPPSDVDLDLLIDSTGTDVTTFVCGLHENFLLSCYSASGDTEATLDNVNSCLDVLSESDLLLNKTFGGRASYTATEGVRQEELAFDVACRGLLDCLPFPVKRQARSVSPSRHRGKGLGKGDAYRMFYPTSLRLWRPQKEMQASLDSLVTRVLNGSFDQELQPLSRLWSRSMSQPGRMTPTQASFDSIHLGSGSSARSELLLERLPYLAKLISRAPPTFGITVPTGLLKDLEGITTFRGMSSGQDDEDEDSEPPPWATGPRNGTKTFGTQGPASENLGVDKLVLSDDDIEDD